METNKVVVCCVEEAGYINITKGKLYTLDTSYGETDTLYWIRDNYEHLRGLGKELFITLEEHREQQLNKLLDE
jgi:glyoxylate utilization-related uncharacterized protein